MNKRIGVCLIIIAVFLPHAGKSTAEDAEDGFSSPINMAEVVLDSILRFESLASKDDRFGPFMDFMIDYPKRTTDFDHMYESFFSPDLVKAWRKAERDQVVQDCDGQYIDGQLCGLGFNPLTCGHDDPPEGYIYRTQLETDELTLVASTWKGWNDPKALYRMVKREGQWRLDGVLCVDGDHFN